jgi:predicted aspartyl protease
MSDRELVSRRERADVIIRQANAAVTQIQRSNEKTQPVVVRKTGDGHFSVRVERPPFQRR